jgi:hypothetical protein
MGVLKRSAMGVLRKVVWEYLRGVLWDYRRLFFDTKCFTSSLCEFLLSPCSAVRINSSLSPIRLSALLRRRTREYSRPLVLSC